MTRYPTPRPPPRLSAACCKTAWAQGYDAAKHAHGAPGGRKGGRSTSEAKRLAARENGRKAKHGTLIPGDDELCVYEV